MTMSSSSSSSTTTTMMMIPPRTFLLLVSIFSLLIGSSHCQSTTPQVDPKRSATAYECNGANQKIIRNTAVREGDEIKICVAPTRETIDDDVYLLKLSNFEFRKTGLKQTAIKDGLVGDDDRTKISCFSGATVCSFTTTLREGFYDTDGQVKVKGEVALQFGRDSIRRHLQQQQEKDDHEVLHITFDLDGSGSRGSGHHHPQQLRGSNNPQQQRSLQTGGFAGWSDVEYNFEVEDGMKGTNTGEVLDDGRDNFREHWQKSPNHIQALYVLGLLVLLIILCCICGACLLWKRCCADAPALVRHSISRVTRGTVFHEDYDYPQTNKKSNEEEDMSETYSDEDEWDSKYPRHVDPEEDDNSSSEEHSDLSEIDEDMLLTNEPHNDEDDDDSSPKLQLMNEPHQHKEPEEIDGKLLLTAVPHQHDDDEDDDSNADDEGDGTTTRNKRTSTAAKGKKKRTSTAAANKKKRASTTTGGTAAGGKKKAAGTKKGAGATPSNNKRKSTRKSDA